MPNRALLVTASLAAALSIGAIPAAAQVKPKVGGFMEQWFGKAGGASGEAKAPDRGGREAAVNRMAMRAPDGVGHDDGGAPNWISRFNDDLAANGADFSLKDDTDSKIDILTPRFFGFQFGLTYVPEPAGAGTGNRPRERNALRDNAFGAGVNYDGSFGDFSVGASAGYMNYGDEGARAGPGPEDIGFGLSLGFRGFTIAGAYSGLSDSVAGHLETYGVGASYVLDPLGVSFGYTRGDERNSAAASDAFEVGVSYQVGPGVSVLGSVYYVDQASAFGADQEGAAVVGGLSLKF